jgi:eukaryotic-like serine/threonine-protein kinase
MTIAACPDVFLMRRLLAGELSAVEATPLEQHLLVCPRCGQQAEHRPDEDVFLRALRAQAGRPTELDDEGVQQVMDRLKQIALPGHEEQDSRCTMGENRLDSLPDGAPCPRPVRGVADASPQSRTPKVPGYEVLEELGHGGMGIIYLARQIGLNRLVALKMIRAGTDAGAEDLQRFQIEAQALARLQHPHIVQIHEVGLAGGLPFFCLEFCAGGSLAERLREGPLPPRQGAQVLAQVAEAVHAAHVAGVIHRDLKPANILLARLADWEPKVTDFGLAKRLDSVDGQTRSGDLLGTPSYMAPEQVEGQPGQIGPATDVYALGAILYELVTGRPPFKAATIRETLNLVCNAEPAPLRQLQPECPRDLETISLKCLEKDPARRYGSGREVAEDLRRYLAGEPIRARPVGLLGRTTRWVKRRPALAALSALCGLATLALLGLGFWFSAEMGAARGALEAEAARTSAADHLAQTHEFFGLLRGVEKRSAQPQPGWTWANFQDLARAVSLSPGLEEAVDLRTEAATALGSIDVRELRTIGKGIEVNCLAFHPKGRLLALGHQCINFTGALCVTLVDSRTGENVVSLTAPGKPAAFPDGLRSLAFSPDGRWLVAGTRYGTLHRWDLHASPPALVSWPVYKNTISVLLFNTDGTALFSASDSEKKVHRWDVRAWEKQPQSLKPDQTALLTAPVGGLAVHPTEGWLACPTHDNRFHVLSSDTLQPVRGARTDLFGGKIHFFPEGNSLVFERENSLKILNLRNHLVVRRFRPPGTDPDNTEPIDQLAVSPDGILVASASAQTKHLQLWEAPSGRQIADLFVGGGTVHMAISPDGRYLAVTGDRRTLLYEIGELTEQTFVASQPKSILTCALHPDGRNLACMSLSLDLAGCCDVALWPLTQVSAPRPTARWAAAEGLPSGEPTMGFQSLSQTLAYKTIASIRVRDSAGPVGKRTMTVDKETALCWSPDGSLWGTVGDEVRVWDETVSRQVQGWSNQLLGEASGKPSIYAVSAGRQWAAAGGRNGQVHLLRAADATRQGGAQASEAPVRAVAFNDAETLLAAGSDTGDLCLLSVPSGEVLATVPAHGDRVEALSWSGSRLLASGSRDRTVKLWNCAGGRPRELLTLRQTAPVRWLAFHPDGARLFVLLTHERAVRVWRLDRLFARLTEIGLSADLEAIPSAPFPAPAPPLQPSEPVREAPGGPNGLKAELFADMDLQRCVKVRYDSQVNTNWGLGSPDPLLPADRFSIRWTGWLKAPRPGRYTLQLGSDDGARLWLDGKRLMDQWTSATEKPHEVDVELSGQPQALRIEYFQVTGGAYIHLMWAQAGGLAMQPVPAEALFHDRDVAAKTVVPPPGPAAKDKPLTKP